MNDQIKQDLVEWDELVAKRPDLKGRCGKWPEWVRGLIGEVERLKQSNSNLLKQYHQRGKDNDKVIYDLVSENTELQKALEWYGDKSRYSSASTDPDYPYQKTPEVYGDGGQRARTALQSIQGGDNT